jgi:hypothetical protein
MYKNVYELRRMVIFPIVQYQKWGLRIGILNPNRHFWNETQVVSE